MALFRAQILLDDTQHYELERLARESGRSMSDLAREIMAEYLERTSEAQAARRSLAALDRLGELRRRIEQQHGCLAPTLLKDLREERDAEVGAAGPGGAASGPDAGATP
jgi:hypothetical protein